MVILAIALGTAAFSAVMASYAILTRELDQGYLSTNPASAILHTDRVDDDLIATVLRNSAISDAEPRRVVNGQIKTGPAQWRNLTLFVVKDYANIHVNKLNPEGGKWPPSTGEILIERDAFQVARATIGQTVQVKTTNGAEQPLLIVGSVHDVGQAQARMENIVYGYINLETLKQLGEQPYLNQIQLLVASNRFDAGHIREVAAEVKGSVESHGHVVSRVDIPEPGKHPHSAIMGLLLLSMSSFGIFILLLSGLLVINLLTALMASQVRQIGVMKAMGGTRLRVARIYLAQSLLLGVAALVIALPLGLFGSRVLCVYLARFLNFDINSFNVPVWVLLLVIVVGVITPVISALYPVWRGTAIPVREALADYGVVSNAFGAAAADRLFANLGAGYLPLTLIVRNAFRKRVRFALTVLTLAAGGLFFMTALNVRESMINSLDHLFGMRNFDLTIFLSGTYPLEAAQKAMGKTPGIAQAEGWLSTRGSVLGQVSSANNHLHEEGAGTNEQISMVAMPADTKLMNFELLSGRAFNDKDENVLVMNSALATMLPSIGVGKSLLIQSGGEIRSWKVIGVAKESFSPPVAYIPISSLAATSPGINSLKLKLVQADEPSINAAATNLDQQLSAEGIRAVATVTKGDSRFGFDQHMLMIYIFLIITSAIIALVGGLGLMTTMSLNVLERRREMGVLRAIGATPSRIRMIIVGEALVIGVLSWLVSILLSWPLTNTLGNVMVQSLFAGGLDFQFDLRGVFIWLVVLLVVSFLGSFLPAWRASKLTVQNSLAYE